MNPSINSGVPQNQLSASYRPSAWRLLSDSIRSLGWRYLCFVIATATFGLATLLPAQLFRYFTETSQSLTVTSAKGFLISLSIFGLLVATALLISSLFSALFHEWLRLRVEAELREKTMLRLHEAPLSQIDSSQRGDWLTRITGDLGRSEIFITESLPGQIRHIAVLFGAGTLFFLHSGTLAFLPLGSALLIALINLWVQRRLAPTLSELRGLHAGIYQMLLESFEGIRTVRSQSAEPFVLRRFQKRLLEISRKSMKVVRYLGALLGGTEFITQALVTLSLTTATLALVKNEITVQQLLVYPFFIGLFYSAAQGLASSAYDWNRFFVEAGRLGEFLYDTTESTRRLLPSLREPVDKVKELKLSDVKVGYANGPATSSLNISIVRGELLAVIGPSGCGKSTLLEVLAGLRPALAGSAHLIDTNGRNLWREEGNWQLPIAPFGYVEQHPYIFEGTLRENLTLGNPECLSDVVLWNFLSRVGLQSFTDARGGLDHFLSDRGRNLSQGERYRIALCRALLLRRPFLLVDEPFASLDKRSVEIVVSALNTEKTETGIVVVTHFLPESLNYDALMDFTNYEIQRRRSSLSKQVIPKTGLEGETLPFTRHGDGLVSTNNQRLREGGVL